MAGFRSLGATGSTQGKLTLGDLGQVAYSLGLQFSRASQVGISALLRWLGASGAELPAFENVAEQQGSTRRDGQARAGIGWRRRTEPLRGAEGAC